MFRDSSLVNGVYSFMVNSLISDTQNPEASGFSSTHAYKYKTKRQAKMKRRQNKMTFLLASHKSSLYLKSMKMYTDHKRVKKIETSLVTFCNADKFTQIDYDLSKKNKTLNPIE